jgi:hypothetical protein
VRVQDGYDVVIGSGLLAESGKLVRAGLATAALPL